MLYTDNIRLKKPAYSEPADIADINENSDIIDREFGNRYLKSETYSVEQANNAIAQAIEALPNGLVYRGAVNYYKDLPTANNELGDTYSVKYQGETGMAADGNEYAWGEYDGTLQWIKLGVNAYTKDEINEQREAIESDILNSRGLFLPPGLGISEKTFTYDATAPHGSPKAHTGALLVTLYDWITDTKYKENLYLVSWNGGIAYTRFQPILESNTRLSLTSVTGGNGVVTFVANTSGWSITPLHAGTLVT